jgi:hypothetical protein
LLRAIENPTEIRYLWVFALRWLSQMRNQENVRLFDAEHSYKGFPDYAPSSAIGMITNARGQPLPIRREAL